MTLTLQKIAQNIRTAEPCFLVVQRANGHWSVGAKIVECCTHESVAESLCVDLKRKNPHSHYGVFALRSEAREIPDPIEIVRVPE